MIESIIIIYLVVGFTLSCFVWKEYDKDTSVERDAIPKWVWSLCITAASLLWPITMLVCIFKGK